MQLATVPTLLAAVLLATAAPLPAQDARTLFSPEGRLLTEGRIFSFACEDLNDDGRPDLVVSDYLNPSRVLFNDAEQRFARVVAFTTTPEMADSGHGVAVADLNGDTRLDLFLVYNEERPSRVLFGDGKGGFTDSGQAIGGPGLFGTAVRVADVDGDGDQDVWVTYFREKARLYLNDGKGAFALSDQVLDTANAVTLGDLDRDGDLDVVSLPPGGGGPATIWLNTRGRFARQEGTLDVGRDTAATRPIDIDGDGDLDLVALARTGQSTLWENDGRGSFRLLEQTLDFGTQAAVGDIDGDGDQDLVIRGGVWLNAGGGRFEKAQTLEPGGLPTGAVLVDIDKDGDLDLLATRGSRETGKADVFLYLNTGPRSSAQDGPPLNEHLKILSPLLHQNWVGDMKSPDGRQTFEVRLSCEAIWNGEAVKCSRSNPERNTFSEGYFYWDVQEEKVVFLSVSNRGGGMKAVVSAEDGKVCLTGTATVQSKTFGYRNTFELTPGRKLVDRWFQNASGSWQPGHVIEFDKR